MIYHLLVMCAARDVTLAEIEAELARREAQSGIAEKGVADLTRRSKDVGSSGSDCWSTGMKVIASSPSGFGEVADVEQIPVEP